jgi:uncharacterized iron-regulated membrane protein
MLRRAHRLIGISLAAPLVLWIATGLLFHVKHRYSEAYETLRVLPESPPDVAAMIVSPATIADGDFFEKGSIPKFALRPDGRGAWFGRKNGTGLAVDAASGRLLAPAPEEEALKWANRAVSASPHAARYGEIVARRVSTHVSPLTLSKNLSLDLSFSGHKTVTVDLVTGEVAQTGDLNDWIAFTYRVHYLQWTPWKPVNIALVLLVSPLVLLLAASGLKMAFTGT